jgi:hypothetical protein
MMIPYKISRTWTMVVLVALQLHCSKPEPSSETILAQIQDRTISVDELKSRAEYALRPAWCRSANYVHRKIVLNSLIAEKMLALEAGTNNTLTANRQFQWYLQGRQEQAMRQWQYYRDLFEPSKPDTAAIRKYYPLAGRTYQIAYFTLADSVRARAISQKLSDGVSFAAAVRAVSDTASPRQRQVRWTPDEHEKIVEELFLKQRRTGQMIGPLVTDDHEYTFIQVLGWRDQVAVTDADMQRNWQNVREQLTHYRANARYRAKVLEIMKGKELRFIPATFFKFAEQLAPAYLQTREQRESAFNELYWQQKDDAAPTPEMGSALTAIADAPLLRLDGRTWTVAEFQVELYKHPLVFRKRRLHAANFPEQLKFAIADLFADKYLTEEAYQKGYDQAPLVQRNVAMWRDGMLAQYQKQAILQQKGQWDAYRKNPQPVIKEVLDPYLQTLRQKYGSDIRINTDAFAKVELSNLDMTTLQRCAPFPVMVPDFPVLTMHSLLDYGAKMND